MAIDLFGHSALGRAETGRRLEALRQDRPDLFAGPLFLAEPSGLGPFGAEIAREFGMSDARCVFGLFVHDKARTDLIDPAVALLLDRFGPGRLVVTYGMDVLHERCRPAGG